MIRRALLVLTLVLCSCTTFDVAVNTAKVQAAGNDRYTELAAEALAGTVDPASGLLPISPRDLAATPPSVHRLLEATLLSLHANRLAAHSVVFQAGEGPDPASLNLVPLELAPQAPRPDPDNDDLFEDEPY